MARKMSKEAYEYVIQTVTENGSMSTDDVVDLIRPFYDFDPAAARERELRRYAGRIASYQRDEEGDRTMFLEKNSSEIISIVTCDDVVKVKAIQNQLRSQICGLERSCRKASNRVRILEGQISLFENISFA